MRSGLGLRIHARQDLLQVLQMSRDTRDDDAHREAALSTAYKVVKRQRKEVRGSRWRWRWRSCLDSLFQSDTPVLVFDYIYGP